MNGVNLGGWLVLERWMTPSLFAGSEADDEYGFMRLKDAKSRIAEHRKTFMTEADWQWLAAHNISFVRLPVGYWALKDDGPFMNAKNTLDGAFKMAEKYDISILLDLHAVKGSQNGAMHSGKKGSVDWWRYRFETLTTLEELARRYKDSPALWGIQVMNEPKVMGNYFKLLWYYRTAYNRLRAILNKGTYTVFHDGFVPPLMSGVLHARKGYPVVMDSHFYLIFSRWLSGLTPKTYDAVRGWLYSTTIRVCRLAQPVLVGEWGSVLPQPMFNRVPKASHWRMLADTIQRQQKTYHPAIASAYWNYKAEGEGMYHLRSLVDAGLVSLD
jgi:glucan 1,3-beta-glucosidase